MSMRGVVIEGDCVLISLTRGQIAMVDPEDADLGLLNWCAQPTSNKRGYYAQRNGGEGRRVHLHRVVAARAGHQIEDLEVDHINGDRLDCRRSNLRPATHTQNVRNRRRPMNSTSGYKGVSWHKNCKQWQAYIAFNSRRLHLGLFATREAAAVAYDSAARNFYGAFARPNLEAK